MIESPCLATGKTIMIRDIVKSALARVGYKLSRIPELGPKFDRLPDLDLYQTTEPQLLLRPWLARGEYAEHWQAIAPHTVNGLERCWTLHVLGTQALSVEGEFWECGVYKGGTALLLYRLRGRGRAASRLRLFDTFEGMPETDPEKDPHHRKGDFSDTSAAAISRLFDDPGRVSLHKGFIPGTFAGLEGSRISFAHIDVDIYRSIMDCCQFIYPRLSIGGFMVFDDYAFPTCPGARQAVDEYFSSTRTRPLVLHTGQAVVFKSVEG